MSAHPDEEGTNITPQRLHRRRWLWILVAAVVAAAGIWLFRTGRTHAQSPVRKGGRQQAGLAVPVAAGKTELGDMPVYRDGLGSVTAYYTVTLHTRVDGQLMEVRFKEGQYVRQGELLVVVDPRPYQVQLETAQGQMERDQATLANARLDLKRYQDLIKTNAIPKQTLDTQVATVAQDEGTVKTDQAAIDSAKLQLVYCNITAPISGRIGLRLVDPGNIVHATDTTGLLVITQMQPITVIFTLAEDYLPEIVQKLHRGAALPVDAFNRDKTRKLASGRLLTVDNQIDQTSGTDRLKAVFENRESTLFPNQFVNVRLLVEVKHNQVIVPSVAIQRGSQGTFVYVIKPDNTVEVTPIKVDITEGARSSISSGLKAGENVVTDGADKLQPGSKVAVKPEPGGTKTASPAGPATGTAGGTGGGSQP